MASSSNDVAFKNLSADDIDHTGTEIESCCMNCYKNVSKSPTFHSNAIHFQFAYGDYVFRL